MISVNINKSTIDECFFKRDFSHKYGCKCSVSVFAKTSSPHLHHQLHHRHFHRHHRNHLSSSLALCIVLFSHTLAYFLYITEPLHYLQDYLDLGHEEETTTE